MPNSALTRFISFVSGNPFTRDSRAGEHPHGRAKLRYPKYGSDPSMAAFGQFDQVNAVSRAPIQLAHIL